jgi:hypothetical protein
MPGPTATNVSAEQQPSATSSEPTADTPNLPDAKDLVREAVTTLFKELSGQPFDRLASLRGGLPLNAAGIPHGTSGVTLTPTPSTPAPTLPQSHITEHIGVASSQPKHSHVKEVSNPTFRTTGSEQQSSSSWFMSRSTSIPQAPSTTRSDSKESTNSFHQRSSSENKTEPTKEPKSVEPRSEAIALDVSHKNIAQTLEAALDKIMKGSAVSAELKQAEALQLSSTDHTGATVTQPLVSATDQSSTKDGILQPSQGQRSEQPQPSPSPTDHGRPQDTAIHLSASQSQELTAKLTALQHAEQLQHQRAEQLRVINQIIAAEADPLPTVKVTTTSFTSDTAVNAHPRHESTTVAVEKVRESVLDKFTSIRTQIETSATERQRTNPTTSTADSLVQGRSNLTQAHPIHHDAKPTQDLRHGDRASDSHSLARAIFGSSVIPLASTTHRANNSTAPANSTPFSLQSLGDILKNLQVFSRRSTNAQLIRRMDSALERTCLTLATGAAIGFIGAEVLAKTVGLGLRQLLRVMRDTSREELTQDEQALESAVIDMLQDYLVQDALEPSARSIVADVSGILICHETQQPIPNVLVGSRELGSCMTDDEGRFIFSNVLVGTAYALTFYKPFFVLTPNTIDGVCSFDSHHTIEITLAPLQENSEI